MKKLLLFVGLIVSALAIHAQSLEITYSTDQVFELNTASYMKAKIHVKNKSNKPKSVKCKKEVIDTVPGTTNYFCWGVCYTETTYDSPLAVDIPAGTTDPQFEADYSPYGKLGVTKMKYTFYDENNPSDAASVTIEYHAVGVGIANSSISSPNQISVSPNPANANTIISYSVSNDIQKATIVIYNMLGSKVYETIVVDKQSNIALNTADLQAGIYFYTLNVDNKAVVTKKLVVSH